MPKLPNWVLPLVAFAILLGVALTRTDLGQAPTREVVAPSRQTNVVWSHGHDGASANAEEHWEKHRADFPEFHSAEDYERGGRNFIAASPPGTLIKHRENGDTLFYDPATNTFAVADGRGEPRTFFRPNSGRAYWDRQ